MPFADKAGEKAYNAERRSRWMRDGLCVRCGGVRHPESASKCQRCLDWFNAYNQRRHNRQPYEGHGRPPFTRSQEIGKAGQ